MKAQLNSSTSFWPNFCIVRFWVVILTLGRRSNYFLFPVCWQLLALVLLSHYYMFLCKIHSIKISLDIPYIYYCVLV